MGVMVEDFKASPKREFKSTKGKKFSRTNLLELLAQGGGSIASYTAEDGTLKMKILVKKQDLKKIMNNSAIHRERPNNASPISSQSSTMERRLYDLMKKKKANNAKSRNSTSWRPVLQSIPEEH